MIAAVRRAFVPVPRRWAPRPGVGGRLWVGLAIVAPLSALLWVGLIGLLGLAVGR